MAVLGLGLLVREQARTWSRRLPSLRHIVEASAQVTCKGRPSTDWGLQPYVMGVATVCDAAATLSYLSSFHTSLPSTTTYSKLLLPVEADRRPPAAAPRAAERAASLASRAAVCAIEPGCCGA